MRGSRHFWPNIENGGCFTHILWTKFEFFCNYLIKYKLQSFCENYSLNSANFTKRVIFCVNSWQFSLGPKIFHTSVTCDKFHVLTLRFIVICIFVRRIRTAVLDFALYFIFVIVVRILCLQILDRARNVSRQERRHHLGRGDLRLNIDFVGLEHL